MHFEMNHHTSKERADRLVANHFAEIDECDEVYNYGRMAIFLGFLTENLDRAIKYGDGERIDYIYICVRKDICIYTG